MTHTAKPTKYRAVCYVCYSCWLHEKPVGKREAARLATSHMNRYRHDVGVSEVEPESAVQA